MANGNKRSSFMKIECYYLALLQEMELLKQYSSHLTDKDFSTHYTELDNLYQWLENQSARILSEEKEHSESNKNKNNNNSNNNTLISSSSLSSSSSSSSLTTTIINDNNKNADANASTLKTPENADKANSNASISARMEWISNEYPYLKANLRDVDGNDIGHWANERHWWHGKNSVRSGGKSKRVMRYSEQLGYEYSLLKVPAKKEEFDDNDQSQKKKTMAMTEMETTKTKDDTIGKHKTPMGGPQDRARGGRNELMVELLEMITLLKDNVSQIHSNLQKDKQVLQGLDERTDHNVDNVQALNERLKNYVEKTSGWTCTMCLMIVIVLLTFVWTFGVIYFL
ncbi:hypothetical protein RFI_06587 [Reticulomyxa filosa]|uniref:Uncharacterized protein n=1 Tax=Reticulomyxa filosa TaxID=46433 RepID=X6NW56_RETFI|nr:hypothetical protein RFI_06587 [Reticulomyxa filosa]|eukprot:ETO30535.1 hypothetical protein RFI_06587 [Reticulomyxa filosa]